MLRERDQRRDPLHCATGRHRLCRAAGERRAGTQTPSLRSSAMERGSDGKSPRHRSEQAERKMLWGEQNLSSLTRGTFWQPEPARAAGGTTGRTLPVAWGMAPGASQAKRPGRGLTRTPGRAPFTPHALPSGQTSGGMVRAAC